MFYLITFIAGMLTILSPCILPVIPFVFSRGKEFSWKESSPLLIGMGSTFVALSAGSIFLGEKIVHANAFGRALALVLLALFGVTLIFPKFSDFIFSPLTRISNRIEKLSIVRNSSFLGSILIGVSTGLLWAPCAGPILGLILTGATLETSPSKSILLLALYALGAMSSLTLTLYASGKFFTRMKSFLSIERSLKSGLGVLILLSVTAIGFRLDEKILTHISTIETTAIESKLIQLTERNTNTNVDVIPETLDATYWLNSTSLSKNDLKGKVVLIDFWTYSCINCLRTLPYVKAWHEKYKDSGLVVIGVHTPEFAFERDIQNVKKALQDLEITYPVAIDNDRTIWNAFKNHYWPAHYFIDKKGNIRGHHFGEGDYLKSEALIQSLLMEGEDKIKRSSVNVQTQGIHLAANFSKIHSPETYLGYKRGQNFISNQPIKKERPVNYSYPSMSLKLNQWALNGQWSIGNEKSTSLSSHAKVAFRFKARDLHLVIGSPSGPSTFQVYLDGHTPNMGAGVDVTPEGSGMIKEHRLYQLIRLPEEETEKEHLFEIEFQNPNIEIYAFTFG